MNIFVLFKIENIYLDEINSKVQSLHFFHLWIGLGSSIKTLFFLLHSSIVEHNSLVDIGSKRIKERVC